MLIVLCAIVFNAVAVVIDMLVAFIPTKDALGISVAVYVVQVDVFVVVIDVIVAFSLLPMS